MGEELRISLIALWEIMIKRMCYPRRQQLTVNPKSYKINWTVSKNDMINFVD